jgi:very-short-patch-repair endonuclease
MVQGSESRYYLDFAFPANKVAIECDGLLGHGSPSAQGYDLKRQNEIIEAGWNLRRFSWSQVNTERALVLESIREAMIASGWHPDRQPPAN